MFEFDDMTKEEFDEGVKEFEEELEAEKESKELVDKERMTEKLEEYFKNFIIYSICSICRDSGFYLQLDEDVPSGLVCMRDDEKHKFDCCDNSGFNMKPKREWYKFRVANLKTGYWEYYKVAEYEQGTGVFEDLEKIEIKKEG